MPIHQSGFVHDWEQAFQVPESRLFGRQIRPTKLERGLVLGAAMVFARSGKGIADEDELGDVSNWRVLMRFG